MMVQRLIREKRNKFFAQRNPENRQRALQQQHNEIEKAKEEQLKEEIERANQNQISTRESVAGENKSRVLLSLAQGLQQAQNKSKVVNDVFKPKNRSPFVK